MFNNQALEVQQLLQKKLWKVPQKEYKISEVELVKASEVQPVEASEKEAEAVAVAVALEAAAQIAEAEALMDLEVVASGMEETVEAAAEVSDVMVIAVVVEHLEVQVKDMETVEAVAEATEVAVAEATEAEVEASEAHPEVLQEILALKWNKLNLCYLKQS